MTYIKGFFISLFLILNSVGVHAQYCASSGHDNSLEWISNVSLSGLDNSSGQDGNAYGDYTALSTVLYKGASYNMVVDVEGGYPEYIDVWIDFNQSGTFEASEKIMSEFGTVSISAMVNIPAGVTSGTTRMRVIMNYDNQTDDACVMNLNYGETEDYTVDIQQNTSPPIADFAADDTITCSGTVNFTDLSQNVPTSWEWDFGDGNTSTAQNPTYIYTASGNYTVQLIVSNSYGSDTLIKTNYIENIGSGNMPRVATCTPATQSYCCGMGIYNVTFNSINYSSADGSEGYQENTCQQTTVRANQTYNLSIETGSGIPENVRVWIDYNDDGSFNATTEEIFASDSVLQYHTGAITIPTGTTTGTALRMRVGSDYVDMSPPASCTDAQYGQFEDYTVLVQPDTIPPTADFTSNATFTCSGTVNFYDNSIGATSWNWDFGDGNTDTVENPVHTYAADGVYIVTLIASNIYGSDTLTKNNYITYSSGGPQAASCIAYTSYSSAGMGIYNVSLNTMNYSSGDAQTEGYQDNSCTQGTDLIQGKNYILSIQTNPNTEEHVRVWIDYNNDGTFDSATEEVFASTALQNHSGTISIPATSDTGTALRMRVAASYEVSNWSTNPTPCDTIDYGQAEDYTLYIYENTQPPAAAFVADMQYTCNGTITFTDSSENLPNSWYWDFGDGNSDTLQNPVHTYTASGIYNVKLVVTNQYGSDSVAINNYITVDLNSTPIAASCAPATTNYCCGYGIFSVSLESINKISGNASEGYQDFTCGNTANLIEGKGYTITLQTNPVDAQDTRVWIDYNNDGIFDNTSELAYSVNNTINPSGSITVPQGVSLNTPLRMRVSSDYAGSNPGPCTDLLYGQAEDYTVVIGPNTDPPVAEFSASDLVSCGGTISFTDESTNIPTSWNWDFGDGNTDTVQNPTHTYTATGYYTVILTATNAYGSDSETKYNYIYVESTTPGPATISCKPETIDPGYGIGIYRVKVNTIDKTTASGDDGYQDFSCAEQTTLREGVSYNIEVETGMQYIENVRIWIDFNNDAAFAPSELFFASDSVLTYHSKTVVVPQGTVYDTSLRMRVMSDYAGISNIDPCNDVQYGQAEDYGVIIEQNTDLPIAGFAADNPFTCSGTVTFSDSSQNLPTSWSWDFGNGTTSTQQNPTHSYSTKGSYTVTLIACNTFGCDTIARSDYISYNDAPAATSCTAPTLYSCCGYGIQQVNFNTISLSSSDATTEGYQDRTCSKSTAVTAGKDYAITVITGINNDEHVRVWIDYNNDATFTSNELVFISDFNQYHTGTIAIPNTGVVLSAPLRMRVISADSYSNWVNGGAQPCDNIDYGQAEDYTVIIQPDTAPPEAGFSYQYDVTCANTVYFTDTSSNFANQWYWNFGEGGSPSTEQNPTHSFNSIGNYVVTLIATNDYGSDTLYQTININAISVIAAFNAQDTAIAGKEMQFIDGSLGAEEWSWDFGDGYASSLQHPAHTYENEGTYTAKLTVTNASGCTAENQKEIFVKKNVGIEGLDKNKLAIAPNPVKDILEIKYDIQSAEKATIELYNLLGEQIYRQELNNISGLDHKIDMTSYPKGIYLLKLSINENQLHHKIAVQ